MAGIFAFAGGSGTSHLVSQRAFVGGLALGLLKSAVIVAAFIPTADVTSVAWFEAKLVLGVDGPVAVDSILFRRTQQSGPPLAV
jgi:hypothetical protein